MNKISHLAPIVVVGEGIAGAATAIVARLQNWNVILIKMREGYTREQIIFLKMNALKFLERINVLPLLKIEIVRLTTSTQALVPISHLEKALFTVANQLGVRIIQGKFENIYGHSIVLSNQQRIPYGILVGADGAHSRVRNALNIKCNKVGVQTLAASAFIPNKMETSQVQEVSTNRFFIRNVQVPSGAFLLMHFKHIERPLEANKEALASAASSCGWGSEAHLLKERNCVVNENVEVNLQQAATFSDRSKDAILVGDSTTTGSFYLGRGANLALDIVEVAEKFFRMKINEGASAYDWYNQQVKKLSDELVGSNLHLFSRL